MATHNAHCNSVRSAYLAKMAERPVISTTDLFHAQLLTKHTQGWLGTVRGLLKQRPYLAEYVQRAESNLKALQTLLVQEHQAALAIEAKAEEKQPPQRNLRAV